MNESTRVALLIYCPVGHGGVAEHAHYQAKALHELGVRVRVLAAKDYLQPRAVPYPVDRRLPAAPTGERNLRRKIRHALWLAAVPWRLASYIWRIRPASVLLASYSEYLSPLWVWPHLLIRRVLRIRYGANLHDPVRDFRLGPMWWHLLSVRLAFDALDYVIVHEAKLPIGAVPPQVAVYEAPVGVYDVAPPNPSHNRHVTLRTFPGAQVLLCFGHIRDNKNIDLLIQALPRFPRLHLVVAGPAAAGGQRPESEYSDLARRLGVVERFRMIVGFVADEDVATYFGQADWVAVTYASSFRSQSGVLNVAARARKQVLASSGPSAMRSVVQRYGLGVFVEPDSSEAVAAGIRTLMENPPVPDWEGYERYASWSTNARVVIAASWIEAFVPGSQHWDGNRRVNTKPEESFRERRR